MPLHQTHFLQKLMVSPLMDAISAGLRKEVESFVATATNLSKVLRVILTQQESSVSYGQLVVTACATMNGGMAVQGGCRGG